MRGRLFPVAADSDSNRKLGGFENEVKPNGNGTTRLIKTRVAWMIGGLKIQCDDTQSDQEFLKEIADGTEYVPMTITFASGFTYQGHGTLVGEFQYSSQDATAEVTLSGEFEATQQ